MSKQVTFGKPERPAASADAWVASRGEKPTPPPMKRLTLDLPEQLHQALKLDCARKGVTMVDALREILLEKYGNE
jgi:hypothetical protein